MLSFQEMIAKLTQFWADAGCIVHQGYDLEVGAGTFNPATFLRCLGPEPYAAVYVEPSRRPQDGRYGENPNRTQFYHQMQVILKPSPEDLQELYLRSLEAVGLNLREHDIRFVHDDWENPTIGASGLGWEVWIDSMEVTQFTYFQTLGGLPVKPVSGELTYGLERLAMYLQGVDSMFALQWNGHMKYGDIYKQSEREWSHYNFTEADTAMWFRHFDDFEAEAKRLIRSHLPIPAYDFVMKASHAFNILDARGVISVTERTGYIGRIRSLAKQLAESYLKSREEQKFPLLREKAPEPPPSKPSKLSTKCNPKEKEDFLLEIGSEELPALFVPIGLSSLERHIRALLNHHHLSFEEIETFGTPRRLAILVRNLSGGTDSKIIERKGPALHTAFDAEGKPTKAGGGFFRSLGETPLMLSQIQKREAPHIEVRKIKEVDYLFANVKQPGISTRALLAEELPKLILDIDFPKKMRWGTLDIEYARPLRWIVALYGTEVLPFSVGVVTADRVSRGHRPLSPKSFPLKKASTYVEQLRAHKVMVSIQERKESIQDQLTSLTKNTPVVPERVLPQVLHLVEWPFLALCSFDSAFLKAPKEVLISEMVEHQKYFPLSKENGDLVSDFVVVCNNTPSEKIKLGNQKALTPRLADGLFLYEEDLKISLEHFNEKLKTITFQKELGSVWDKVLRLIANVEILHTHLPLCELADVQRAATLAKADLASGLVGEFPELQGVAGRLYALKHGEKSTIAQAIDEHWMPRGEKAPLPQTPCGILLSLAEKIDNFLSCFTLGLEPSSSSDPYGLRRQALGLLKMLIENKLFLPIRVVLGEAFDHFILNPHIPHKTKQKMEKHKEETLNHIVAFLVNRLRTLLVESHFEKDEIEAVLVHPHRDLFAIYQCVASVHAFRKEEPETFHSLLEIHTRAKKILFSQNAHLIPGWLASQHGTVVTEENRFPEVDPSSLQEEIEKELFNALSTLKNAFHTSLLDRRDPTNRNYKQAFNRLAQLQKPLAILFDTVKILDDDPKARLNRLALLQDVWDLCEELLDFSKIQEL